MNAPVEDIFPCDKRVQVVGLGLFLELGFQLSQFLRVFLGKVDRLRGIFIEVVKLQAFSSKGCLLAAFPLMNELG